MSRRRGFTLLELMLATVLMSVLMIGVLAVLTQVLRPAGGQNERAKALGGIDAGWVGVMRGDLLQARAVQSGESRIELMGYVGLDPATGERTQRPARVAYHLAEDIAGRSWLVRSETPMDTGGKPTTRHELLGGGVTRFTLTPPRVGTTDRLSPAPASGPASGAGAAGGGAPMGLPADEAWRLRLWAGDQADPAVDRVLVVRGGVGG